MDDKNRKVWKGEWDEEPAKVEPNYYGGLIDDSMTMVKYDEIVKAYLVGKPHPGVLDPRVVLEWWKEWGSLPVENSGRPEYYDGDSRDPDERFPFDDANDWEY